MAKLPDKITKTVWGTASSSEIAIEYILKLLEIFLEVPVNFIDTGCFSGSTNWCVSSDAFASFN